MKTTPEQRARMRVALDFIPEAKENVTDVLDDLDEALTELAAAREREGLRLAAISTLCTSPAHLEGMHPDFDSAALQDVRRLVARYEAELAALRRVERGDMHAECNHNRERGRRWKVVDEVNERIGWGSSLLWAVADADSKEQQR